MNMLKEKLYYSSSAEKSALRQYMCS